MRKTLALILVLLLLLSLLSGCDEEDEPTEIATRPTVTTAPAEETTERPEETEAPAEDAEGETEISDESPLNTTVLRSGEEGLQAEYILLAVSPEGPFHSEDIAFNETGADALIRWLMGDQARAVLENFGAEEYGEPVFSLPEKLSGYLGWIPNATEETKTIRLSVADTLEESGVLTHLLTEFEKTYGYEVSVQATSASGAVTAAKLGMFDLVLTESSTATDAFIADGYVRVVDNFDQEAVNLCGVEYLLCGPKTDPAGTADAETLADAFAAIAEGKHIFLSRGDDSTVHKLEKSLWPAGQEFAEWYLNVETDMGPLLIMTEMEGGYVLTDKLTWLIFYHNNGII